MITYLLLASLAVPKEIKFEELLPLVRMPSIEVKFGIDTMMLAGLVHAPRVKELRARGRERTVYETLELIELSPESDRKGLALEALQAKNLPPWSLVQLYCLSGQMNDAEKALATLPETGRDNLLARLALVSKRLSDGVSQLTVMQSILQISDPEVRASTLAAMASAIPANVRASAEAATSQIAAVEAELVKLDPQGKDRTIVKDRNRSRAVVRFADYAFKVASKDVPDAAKLAGFMSLLEGSIDDELKFAKDFKDLPAAYGAVFLSLFTGLDFQQQPPAMRPEAKGRYDRALATYEELSKGTGFAALILPDVIEVVLSMSSGQEMRPEVLERSFKALRPHIFEVPELASSMGVGMAVLWSQAGRTQEADDLFKELIDKAPSDYVFAVASKLAARKGQWAESERLATKIKQLGEYARWRGLVLNILRTRNATSAKQARSLADEFVPIFKSILAAQDAGMMNDAVYHSALLSAMVGEPKTALEIVQKFRSQVPDDELGTKLEALLKRG